MASASKNVTKKDIVEEIADQTGLKQTDSKIIIERFLDEIVQVVSEGNNIEIRGFGRFKIKPRKERVARNPRSGETVMIPAGLKPVFEPSKELKNLLKQNNDPISEIQKELSKIHG